MIGEKPIPLPVVFLVDLDAGLLDHIVQTLVGRTRDARVFDNQLQIISESPFPTLQVTFLSVLVNETKDFIHCRHASRNHPIHKQADLTHNDTKLPEPGGRRGDMGDEV